MVQLDANFLLYWLVLSMETSNKKSQQELKPKYLLRVWHATQLVCVADKHERVKKGKEMDEVSSDSLYARHRWPRLLSLTTVE